MEITLILSACYPTGFQKVLFRQTKHFWIKNFYESLSIFIGQDSHLGKEGLVKIM